MPVRVELGAATQNALLKKCPSDSVAGGRSLALTVPKTLWRSDRTILRGEQSSEHFDSDGPVRSAIMKPLVQLTDRDLDILRFLSLRVRVAAHTQIARTWWPHVADAADVSRRRLSQLRAFKLVQSQEVMAMRPPLLLRPLCAWSPGELPPNLGRVAWLLHKRAGGRCVRQLVYIATTLAARRFAGIDLVESPTHFKSPMISA